VQQNASGATVQCVASPPPKHERLALPLHPLQLLPALTQTPFAFGGAHGPAGPVQGTGGVAAKQVK